MANNEKRGRGRPRKDNTVKNVSFEGEILDRVVAASDQDNRMFSNMVNVLLREALDARAAT